MCQASFMLLVLLAQAQDLWRSGRKKEITHCRKHRQARKTPGVDAVTSVSQPTPLCQPRLSCLKKTCSCRGRKAPSVGRCCVYSGDTAGHRHTCVCSRVWGCKCSWTWKINKLLDRNGRWVRKHCPFLPTKKNVHFISIILMKVFLVALVPQWVQFLQAPHQLPLQLFSLAWIQTSPSNTREPLGKLSPLQKMAFHLAEIKLAKEMLRKPRTLTLAPL